MPTSEGRPLPKDGPSEKYIDFLNAFYTYVVRSGTHSPEEESAAAAEFVRGYEDGADSPIDLEVLRATYQLFIEERIASTWPMFQHYFQDETKNDHMLAGRSAQIRTLAEHPNKMLDLVKAAATSNQ